MSTIKCFLSIKSHILNEDIFHPQTLAFFFMCKTKQIQYINIQYICEKKLKLYLWYLNYIGRLEM